MKTREIRLAIVGLGNLGRRLLQILDRKAEELEARYGIHFVVVGAADSRGAVADPNGLSLSEIIRLKENGESIAAYPGRGQPGLSPLSLVQQVEADALCEASPVNLEHGGPGLNCIRTALNRGMHVVTPNKGPMVLAYDELTALAREKGVSLRFCGTVAGGLPAINIGQRDLAGAIVTKLEALPNLTTSFILDLMAHGQSYEQALAEAQAQGCAEADPSLDVDGWDAACKLVILANSVLGIPAGLDDVDVQGITGVTLADLETAKAAGKVIKLVAAADRREDGSYALSVAPTPLPNTHPLAQLSGQQMGVVYHTDIYGVISAAILEEEPVPSAATMLRDLLAIYAG